MSITRTAIVDDDGSRTTGTVLNNAWKQELYDQIDASLGSVPTIATARTDSGAVNNWTAVTGGAAYIPWNGAADATISGLAGGFAGQLAIVKNITAAKVAYFPHLSGLSSAANQFSNYATSGPTPVGPGGMLAYLHNGTNWQLFFHEQGAWISPTYAAGNFTASAGTWSVDAGDVITYASSLSGRRLTVTWWLNTTSTGVGMGTDLRIAIPGGFTSAKDLTIPSQTGDNNVSASGLAVVASSGGTVIILRLVNSAAWTSSVTNLTFARGEITIEVN